MASIAWLCGDLLTGRISAQIPAAPGCSWSNVMDDAGALQLTTQLDAPDVQALNLPSAAAPARAFLAAVYLDDGGNASVLEAGPIWVHDYDDETKQLVITAAGMWSYFDHRKVMQVLAGANPAAVQASYSGLSYATIAKRLVQLAQSHTGGDVPIVLPGDVAVSADLAHVRNYPGYALAWVGDELRNLVAVAGGPEIAFSPRLAADSRYIEWVMRTGAEADPLLHQSGADWVFDATVPNTPVTGIGVTVDGSGMGDEAYVKGSGDGQGALIGHTLRSTLTGAGYPLLEVDLTGQDQQSSTTVLQNLANQTADTATRQALAFRVRVHRDTAPNVSLYAVGDYAQLIVPVGHPYFPAGGTFRTRLTGRSGDDSEQVTLQVAAIPGAF